MWTVRVFDIGGGGLKTALVDYHDDQKKLKIREESVLQLGKCPEDKIIEEWIREKIPTLNQEIAGSQLFGCSISEKKKMWVQIPDNAKDLSIYQLFKIQENQMRCVHDGAAHLEASLNELELPPEGVIWNFSLGTGVGCAMTDEKRQVRPTKDLTIFFEQVAYDVKEPTTQEPLYKVGSGRAFVQLVKDLGEEEAIKTIAARWKAFIQEQMINRSTQPGKEWGKPATVIFTGGLMDHQGPKIKVAINPPIEGVNVLVGPKNGGLLGAAWHVVKNCGK